MSCRFFQLRVTSGLVYGSSARGRLMSTDTLHAQPIAEDSYQLMQRSKLPTMHFQRSLPRLPIPLLPKTTERFLAAVQCIVNEKEFEHTQKVTQAFKEGVGTELQALLKQRDTENKHTSYISDSWFDMYLRDRAPLPLNYNPLLVMKSDSRPQFQQQIVRAANLVISSLRFWRSLQSDELEPEVYHLNPAKSDTPQFWKWMRLVPGPVATYAAYAFKAFPLDMSQYKRLFGVSRIPMSDKDQLVQAEKSRHILVLRRGNMYAVEVLDKNGNIEPPREILGKLQAVLRLDETQKPAAYPLGVLTAINRDSWARTREHICQLAKGNRQLFEQKIDNALFCLCLDTPTDPQYDEKNPVPLLKHYLAGDATNRWFDKSVSVLIGADGTTAVNFEHSWGDGVAVLRYFNEIYKETLSHPFVDTNDLQAVGKADMGIEFLNFQMDDKAHAAIDAAKQEVATTMRALNMHMLRYPKLNKLTCKTAGVSPDALMQLSFQLAYRQAFNTGYVGSYESCSTAAFRHGRTETIRPCTMATKRFCETVINSKQATSEELLHMLKECSAKHGQLTKEAAMGQGFDRHLFALKNVAQLNNIPLPELYNTDAYRRINHNIISTSTLASEALLAGSFGPVVQNGLGIGYSIKNDECGAIVTSYEQQCCGKAFVNSLEESLDTIHKIISVS